MTNVNNGPVTEAELVEAATAVRVTADRAEAAIVSEYFTTALDAMAPCEVVEARDIRQLGLLTLCVLVLENGFTVVGKSACASPENFNEKIGQRLAREDAKRQVWGYLGYELRTKLSLKEQAHDKSHPSMDTYIGSEVVHAMPMSRAVYNITRGWELPVGEDGADAGYLVEHTSMAGGNLHGYVGHVNWLPKDAFEATYGSAI